MLPKYHELTGCGKIDRQKTILLPNPDLYSLREIKTPEEMALMRKTVSIPAIAHAEVMKAIRPGMGEAELQGLQEYIHKKLGAE